MGTLPHFFLFRMFFLGHWAWQSAARQPSISQKGHVVPELPGLRHSHRSGSAIRMGQPWGAAPPTLGGSALLPWPRALGTFRAGQLGAKDFSGTRGLCGFPYRTQSAGIHQFQGQGLQ